MAENILGLLLVLSTPKDRHVFRYPPDPTSPEARLSQPVYSRATHTAKDTAVDPRSHRLFPKKRGEGSRAGDSRFSNTHFWSSNHSSARAATRPGAGSECSSLAPASAGSFHSHQTEYGTPPSSSSSSSSDDSDFYRLFDGGVGGTSYGNGNRRYSSETDGSQPASVRPNAPRPLTEIVQNRRGSVVESEATHRQGSSRKGRKGKPFVEAQYNYALGYSLDFLGDLLTPPRVACNRKFEVCVDELVFIGHPVCTNSDGKWEYPADDSDDDDEPRRVSRGRRMNDTPAPRDVSLLPVAEHPDSPATRFEKLQEDRHSLHRDALNASTHSLANSASDPTSTPRNVKKDEEEPQLTMFHLVLIIDKPDPQADSDTHLAEVYSHLYREIAFKWTAAAFALQVRENWVAREAKELARIREKAIMDGVPVVDCLRKCVELSSLAQSMHELFSAMHKIKLKPMNTLFVTMPTTVTVNVGSVPITIVIPPTHRDAEGPVAMTNSYESDSSDDDSDDEWAGVTGPDGLLVSKQPHLRVQPWQTLLMLDDEGGAAHAAPQDARPRRDSKSQQAEDELIDALIRACDITKPLHEIAHTLRYDLEGIVIPLARELVQSKRAILIDVVNVRLRTILMPTSITDHLRSIGQHCVRWQVMFPNLPPLIPFIAMISQSPQPFRDLLPAEAQVDTSKRDIYIRAVTWLLRNDLVQQYRVRARVIASSAVKEAAWRRLWHRRRNKWLRERTASMTSKTSAGSKGSRPSFSASTTVGAVTTVSTLTSPKSDMATPRAGDTLLDSAYASRVPRLPGGLEVTRTATTESFLDYDSDLEMDSDVEGDGPPAGEGENGTTFGEFRVDEPEPAAGTVPKFSASFIFFPAKAQKEEARWLRVIREHSGDPVLRSRFDLCVQYFDGVTTFEEIMFRTGLSRRELDRIAHVYRGDFMITIQP